MNEPKQMHSKSVLNYLHRALKDQGSLRKLSSTVSQDKRMPTRGQLLKEELSNVRLDQRKWMLSQRKDGAFFRKKR